MVKKIFPFFLSIVYFKYFLLEGGNIYACVNQGDQGAKIEEVSNLNLGR